MPAPSLRVLVAIPVFLPARDYGGPVEKFHTAHHALRGLGVDLHFLTSDYAGPGNARLPLGEHIVEDCHVERLTTLFGYRWGPWVNPFARPKAFVSPPDLVHIVGAWNGLSYSAFLFARRANVPVVWEPIGMLTSRGRHRRIKNALSLAHQKLAARSATIIWTSPQERAEAALADVPAGHLRPNPLNVPPARLPEKSEAAARLRDRIRSTARGTAAATANPLNWGYLGRIAARKGIDIILSAWQESRQTAPFDATRDARCRTNGQLIFAGPPEDHALVDAINKTHGAHYIGALDATARWEFLRGIDALIVVPEFGENFANVVIEAIAVGTPVIVSAAVGANAYLTDAHTTRLTPAGLVEAFRLGRPPPPPAPLPANLFPGAVAAQQHAIYLDVLAKGKAKKGH